MEILKEETTKRNIIKSNTKTSTSCRIAIPTAYLKSLDINLSKNGEQVEIHKYKDFIVVGKNGCSFSKLSIVENTNDELVEKRNGIFKIIDEFVSALKIYINKF